MQFLGELSEIMENVHWGPDEKMPKMRSLLEQICKAQLEGEVARYRTLHQKIHRLSQIHGISKNHKKKLNKLRFKSNQVLHEGYKATEHDVRLAFQALNQLLNRIFQISLPDEVSKGVEKEKPLPPRHGSDVLIGEKDQAETEIPPEQAEEKGKGKGEEFRSFIRGIVVNIDREKKIFELESDQEDSETYIVRMSGQAMEPYLPSFSLLKDNDNVGLLDVNVQGKQAFPYHLIFEPDYLVDISALAAAVDNFHNQLVLSPIFFHLRNLQPTEPSVPLMLGNVVNSFLDNLIFADGQEPDFNELIKSTFPEYALKYLALEEEIGSDFSLDAISQMKNLDRVIRHDFKDSRYAFEPENLFVEPAFLSPELGLQGRMDLLELKGAHTGRPESANVVELKSGKVPWPPDDFSKTKESHAAQARLYRMVLERCFQLDAEQVITSVLYSRSEQPSTNLRDVSEYKTLEKQILNLRNVCIAEEASLREDEDPFPETSNFLNGISFAALTRNYPIPFPDFISGRIESFRQVLKAQKNRTLLKYYRAFVQFIYAELWLGKVGDGKGFFMGQAALWNEQRAAGEEDFDCIEELEIEENHAGVKAKKQIKFRRTDDKDLVNFREGDICVLYPKDNKKSNATNQQILKGTLVSIDQDHLVVQFRQEQQNQNYFEANKKWALEHDHLDISSRNMLQSLYYFLNAATEKKELLLTQRAPLFHPVGNAGPVPEEKVPNENSRHAYNKLINNALAAQDYFLVEGPPGTGKTDIFIKYLTKEFLTSLPSEDKSILLLAYTNRAVDEICESIKDLFPPDTESVSSELDLPFIRIGSTHSCKKAFQPYLIQSITEKVNNRKELLAILKETRIFVSTVASIQGKIELFKVKSFDLAVVDEASQLLEPHLVGILSQVNRFILVGDQKQLPAIVLQEQDRVRIKDEELLQIGLFSRANSLFERLLLRCKDQKWYSAYGSLAYQGRMHPEIACFSNYSYYRGGLKPAGLKHQLDDQPYSATSSGVLDSWLRNRRLLFFGSRRDENDLSDKTNSAEAKAVAILAETMVSRLGAKPENIGVITPYRNQIALIKQEIEGKNIPSWESIKVDTVERYQGGSKDYVILSMSVNKAGQLGFLSQSLFEDKDPETKTSLWVDRKLNVALTRAREQMVLLGNEGILLGNRDYYMLIEFIKSHGGYVEGGVSGLLSNEISPIEDFPIQKNLLDKRFEPSKHFQETFEEIVIKPIKEDKKTRWPDQILGYSNDQIRLEALEFGRARFDEDTFNFKAEKRVLLYCYFNMRKHFFSNLSMIETNKNFFLQKLRQNEGRLHYIDIGAGPATGILSLLEGLPKKDWPKTVTYVPIDVSDHMMEMGSRFLQCPPYKELNLEEKKFNSWKNAQLLDFLSKDKERTGLVLVNFSYLFGNLSEEDSESLAEFILDLRKAFWNRKIFGLFQNTTREELNESYTIFKKKMGTGLKDLVSSSEEVVKYANKFQSDYDKQEVVYYEIFELTYAI